MRYVFSIFFKCIPKFYLSRVCVFPLVHCSCVIFVCNALCIFDFVFKLIPKFYMSRVCIFQLLKFDHQIDVIDVGSHFQYFGVKCRAVSRIFNILE